MLSRSVTLALLGLMVWSCSAKDESTALDPGAPVDKPHPTRAVVDSGLVHLDMDADVYDKGGSTGVYNPDAGPKPDHAILLDAPADLSGPGALCDVFTANSCAKDYACYPKADGSGTCQLEGFLPVASQCDPMGDSPDSRCAPGNTCIHGLCTGLCQLGSGNAQCVSSPGSTCDGRFGISTVVGYCAWEE